MSADIVGDLRRIEAERDALRAVVERVRALHARAEEGAGAWGTCSGEWLRIDELRAALDAD